MDGLDAALERARQAHTDEREMMRVRQDAARERNRLRKVSPASMVSGRAAEMLAELDWWGIPRPPNLIEAERAKEAVLSRLEQRDSGSPGYAEWRAAGFELLRFWVESGKPVTATKVNQSIRGGEERPSAAVAFLAEHLPRVVPGLEGKAHWTQLTRSRRRGAVNHRRTGTSSSRQFDTSPAGLAK